MGTKAKTTGSIKYIASKFNETLHRKEKLCTFFAYLTYAKTVCTIKEIPKSMLIRDFKEYLVLICGVPLFIQRLYYLDLADLNDNDNLYSLDIVDNASFRVGVCDNYEKLMRSIHSNDFESLLTCDIQDPKEKLDKKQDETSVKDEIPSKNDSVAPLITKETVNVYKKRAETALFVASQIGQLDIMKNLIELGVDLDSKTKLGYTALHASVASGHYECIDYLLKSGATCDTKSKQAKKAINIAKLYGFDESERHLRSFEWQTRAKLVKPPPNVPLLMHQQQDSQNPTWLSGPYDTKYICATLPTTEFSGTKIDSPKIKPVHPSSRKKYNLLPDISMTTRTTNDNVTNTTNDNLIRSTEWKEEITFDKWLHNKKKQNLLSIKHAKEMEAIRLQEKQEKEKNRRIRKVHFVRNQKRRKSRTHDELNETHKITIHGDHKYLPNFQSSLIRQYMNELFLEHE